jgi:phage terminase large subunit-like protein
MPQKRTDWSQLVLEAADKIKEQSVAPNIKKYRPHTKQSVFHKTDKKRRLYIGGNRSGKTTAGVCEGIWRASKTHPYRTDLNNIVGPVRGRVVGVDFVKGIDQILVPQYKQWTPPSYLRGGSWETAYDRGSRILYFENRSTIEFMSYDQDVDKFAGTSRHWIHFDEEPPRPIWVECLARLIDTDGDWWLTMTPVEGMTWIYDDIYEKNVDNADGDVEVIIINTFENPYLTESGIQGLMDVTDDDDKTARIGGAFVTVGGRIYKNFDPTPGAAQVLIDPIDDPKTMFPERNWLWIMALDHGLNNPTAVLWLAFDPNGFGVVFDEYYKAERTIDQNAHGIKQIILQHGRAPDLLVADPSINNRQANNMLSIKQEYQKYGLSFSMGNNDVRAGIVRVKKHFNKYPYVSAGYSRPEFMGGPKPGTNLNEWKAPTGEDNLLHRLRISPKCVNLIWELKRYRWMTYTNKKLAFERNAYEEPNKKDDHACDALRYAIMTRPDLTANAGHTDYAEARQIMAEMDQRLGIGVDPGHRVDDPNFLRDAGYDPSRDGAPSPVEGGWDYDEHMGGYF